MTQLNLCLSICIELDVTNRSQIRIAQISESSRSRSRFKRKTELQGYSQFFDLYLTFLFTISESYDIIDLSR